MLMSENSGYHTLHNQDSDDDAEGCDDDEHDNDDDDKAAGRETALQRELASVPLGQLLAAQQTMTSRDFDKLRAGIRATRPIPTPTPTPTLTPPPPRVPQPRPPNHPAEPLPRPQSAAPSKRWPKRRRSWCRGSGRWWTARDPRFDRLSGHFEDGLFAQSYAFIKEYEKSEVDMLRKEIAKVKDKERKMELERALDTAFCICRRQGVALVEQYKNLGSVRVNKMMEKRRKKNWATERQYMPYQRR
ncbi:hypothetical protein DFJ73DRAFT_803793 [Zopfochytrium polystomum]|nr:hypothetical protein DFJ73DRAFT_803793 [Zopfochytrium polystomum]